MIYATKRPPFRYTPRAGYRTALGGFRKGQRIVWTDTTLTRAELIACRRPTIRTVGVPGIGKIFALAAAMGGERHAHESLRSENALIIGGGSGCCCGNARVYDAGGGGGALSSRWLGCESLRTARRDMLIKSHLDGGRFPKDLRGR